VGRERGREVGVGRKGIRQGMQSQRSNEKRKGTRRISQEEKRIKRKRIWGKGRRKRNWKRDYSRKRRR
jgi:hypothetical protein